MSIILNTQEKALALSRDELPEGPARFSVAVLALINLAIFSTLLYSVVVGLSGNS